MDYADQLDMMDDDCDIQGFYDGEIIKGENNMSDIENAIEFIKYCTINGQEVLKYPLTFSGMKDLEKYIKVKNTILNVLEQEKLK